MDNIYTVTDITELVELGNNIIKSLSDEFTALKAKESDENEVLNSIKKLLEQEDKK